MTPGEWVGVGGLAFTVAGGALAVGRFVLGAVIREDMSPLRDAVLELKKTTEALAKALDRAERDHISDRAEMKEAIEAIREVLQEHANRLTILETGANVTARVVRKPRKATG